jgi:MFS family permease
VLLGGVLTSYLNWRWCLYVILFFAAIAVFGGLLLLSNPPRGQRPRIDLPGTLLASAGLFAVVFGFSEAQTKSWGNPTTVISLAAGVVLIGVFIQVQRTVANPLLPLRVVLDRNRGGAYLAVAFTFVAAFSIFLFLTYFLQEVRGFSPVRTGVAFVPLPADIVLASTFANIALLPRFGSRRLVISGLLLGAVGMGVLTRLHANSGYASHVLPALVILGLGFGCIVAPAFNTATQGVDFKDAGVASAMVNTMQQVGGSIGTALLSTFAAHATSRYLHSHSHGAISASLGRAAATHGYTTAFAVAAGVFLVAAVVCGSLIRRHPRNNPLATSLPVSGTRSPRRTSSPYGLRGRNAPLAGDR